MLANKKNKTKKMFDKAPFFIEHFFGFPTSAEVGSPRKIVSPVPDFLTPARLRGKGSELLRLLRLGGVGESEALAG